MPKRDLLTLLVGPARATEFAEIGRVLRAGSVVCEVTDSSAALEKVSKRGPAFDLIVLLQTHPGQYAAGDLQHLHTLAPLARFVSVLGAWCEGETRTGNVWPGAMRVYWYHAAARFSQFLPELRAGRCAPWSLPMTAADDERLLAASRRATPVRESLVIISAKHFDTADAIADACRSRGHATLWVRPGEVAPARGAYAGVWDGSLCEGREQDELRQFVGAMHGSPVLALLDFPRWESCERASAAGARQILAKPYLVEDLLWRLDQMTAGTANESRAA